MFSPCRRAAPTSIHTVVRHASTGKPGATGQADPKKEIMRRMLYPANIKNRASPTGTWRRDVARTLRRAIPSAQAHETIERAWLLYQRHLRQDREADVQRKFERMRDAMAELETLSPVLFREANLVEDPRRRSEAEVEAMKTMKTNEKKAFEGRIRGLFPREMRIPTDTPPTTGWNHDWAPPKRLT
jgi:large subunit ribosomal protein L40